MTTRTQSSLMSNLLLSTSLRRSTLMLSLAVGMVGLSAPAYAVDDLELPTGGSVVGGDATINYAAPGQLDVQQNSDRLVVDWDKFNIGRSATTTFIQPGSSSLAVNRVTGKNDNPTQILGTLKANGQVMVLDRNGVIFGRTARVDVGGIVASTGTVSAAQVMSGSNKIDITDMADATVENQGTITAADGGLAALVAPTVRNSGVINAKLGRVALAAGEAATVDLYGDNLVELQLSSEATKAVVEHTGTINAQGGSVQLTAQAAKDVVDSVVNMDGVINASSVSEKGGRIVLSADTINVRGTATANGSKGGSVNVNARSRARVESGARIEASSNQGRNAGTIEVKAGDSLHVAGTLQAHGADQTGFIDTSAADVSFAETASVTTNGEWLIDPININIGPILEALLEMQLNLFGNATVTTPAIGPQAGNIYVERKIDWNTNNRLTLNAINDILLNSAASGLNATGGGSVVLNAGRNIGLMNGSGIVTNGGDVTMNARRFRLNSGVVNANGGDIDINNTDGFQAVAGSIRTSGTGTISLNQNKDADAFLSSNTIQNAVDAVSNTGTGLNTIDVGAGTYSEDVVLNKANMVLNGANASTAGYMARVAETVISGASTGVSVTANHVTINGFKLVGGANTVNVTNASNFTFVNNIVTGSSADALVLSSARSAFIDSNLFTGLSANGIDVLAGSDNTSVSNNVLNDLGSGKSTSAAAIYVNTAKNSTIDGNSIGYSDFGLTSAGVKNVRGEGILLVNTLNGVGERTQISGNYITQTKSNAYNYGSGIHVRVGSHIDIGGVGSNANHIVDTAWDGVRLYGGTDVNVVGNDIANVARTGVYAEGITALNISGNHIDGTMGYHGVDVYTSRDSTVADNVIVNTYLAGINIDGLAGTTYVSGNIIDRTGRSAIVTNNTSNMRIVGNVIGANGGNVRGDGILVQNSLNNGGVHTEIKGNTITGTISTAWDSGSGIQVRLGNRIDIGGTAVGEANNIYSTAWDAIRLYGGQYINVVGNVATDLARTGIYAEGIGTLNVADNLIDTTGSHYGIDVSGGRNININRNAISKTNLSAIHMVGTAGSVVVDSNVIADAGTNGIESTRVADLILTNNQISKVAQSGIYLHGPDYIAAVVAGNTISDADVGMTFESGMIDLTGATNKLNGGRIGYRFAPVVVKGGFSQVDLQGDTIGTTEFAGQSDFYVELLNGALFAPGTPTLEDGLNASYDGFVPSSVGGILTAAQYTALENMFFHYNDDPAVGLFFFGQLASFQQSRVFRQDITSFVPGTGNAGFTITGLPRVPGGVGGTPPAGGAPTNPADLNNLAPAAGGGNVGTPPAGQTPEELAAIAPAAGGGQNTSCWSDAANVVGAGQVANYNFNADPLSALQDASACGNLANN